MMTTNPDAYFGVVAQVIPTIVLAAIIVDVRRGRARDRMWIFFQLLLRALLLASAFWGEVVSLTGVYSSASYNSRYLASLTTLCLLIAALSAMVIIMEPLLADLEEKYGRIYLLFFPLVVISLFGLPVLLVYFVGG